jgi:DNA-binding response OmpR family regulator
VRERAASESIPSSADLNSAFYIWAQALLCSEVYWWQTRYLVKKKLRILGVDDEPIIGESMAYVLEAPHRKVVIAKDGQEALALAAKEKFDVVITDHRMPRSGGLELVRKLRERKYTGKIVILSAHLSSENIGTYEELAVDEIVGKPFDSTELRELIAGLEDEV